MIVSAYFRPELFVWRGLSIRRTSCFSKMQMDVPPHVNDVTKAIIGAAIEVHSVFGAGVFERVYAEALCRELTIRRLRFERERFVPAVYKGTRLSASYRIDLVVEDTVIVEIKAIETILPVHEAQLLAYLRLTRLPVGLLINFNVPRLTEGIRRKANTRPRRHSAEHVVGDPWNAKVAEDRKGRAEKKNHI